MLNSRSIFISYRQIDSKEIVDPIYEKLTSEFGESAVFLDIHNIPPGRDYRKVIKQNFGQCRVLIAVIGPDWIDVRDDNNNHRLDNPADWVRLEISSALEREDPIPVIPLLVKGARMPCHGDLPECLQDLAYRQKEEIRSGRDFSSDINRLVEWLRHDLEESATPSLWIHGWTKYTFVSIPQQTIDWTPYFDIRAKPRRIATQTTWEQTLLPQIREEASKIQPPSVVDIRGKLPLTAALAIGTAFPTTLGYTLQTEQLTDGHSSIWRSDADHRQSDMTFEIAERRGKSGKNLLIALAISGRGWSSALELFENSDYDFSAVVCAEPKDGPSERSIHSDADAMALVISAKELIRECRSEYQALAIHLIPYGPQGFFLFLGQRLRVLGNIVTYEWTGQGYESSVVLHTDSD